VTGLVKQKFMVDPVSSVGYFRRYEITIVAKNVRRGTRHRTEHKVSLRLSGVCQEEYLLGFGQRNAAYVVLLPRRLQCVRTYWCYLISYVSVNHIRAVGGSATASPY
jgi:hypothetical protein